MSVSVRKSDGQVFRQWNEKGKRYRKYYGSGDKAMDAARQDERPKREALLVKAVDKQLDTEYGRSELGRFITKAISEQITKSTDEEKVVVKELAFILNGVGISSQFERRTSVGYADLLTDTEIIEVKYHQQWKSALGQVLAYNVFTKMPCMRIHLFDKPNIKNSAKANKEYIKIICRVCSQFGVNVSFREYDKYDLFDSDNPENMVHPSFSAPTYSQTEIIGAVAELRN